MDYQTNCVFSVPEEISAGESTGVAFSVVNCTTTNPVISQITATTGENFYLNQTWSYGELFVAFFIFAFTIYLIVKTIFNFFFDVVVKIKRTL